MNTLGAHVLRGVLLAAAGVAAAGVAAAGSATTGLAAAQDGDSPPLDVTIRPSSEAVRAPDFQSSYVPLSDGGVIDFSSWMAMKYGLADWVSETAMRDLSTGQGAATLYGLDRVNPDTFEEDTYVSIPALPGCGALSRLLLARSSCSANWQRTRSGLTGEGVLKPQMVGLLDFNDFTALTPADRELGTIRFTAPPTSLSLVP